MTEIKMPDLSLSSYYAHLMGRALAKSTKSNVCAAIANADDPKDRLQIAIRAINSANAVASAVLEEMNGVKLEPEDMSAGIAILEYLLSVYRNRP